MLKLNFRNKLLILLTLIVIGCNSGVGFHTKYSLKKNENVKYFQYPYEEGRNNFLQNYRSQYTTEDINYFNSMVLAWEADTFMVKSTTLGQRTLKGNLSVLADLPTTRMRGDSLFLTTKMNGDLLYRVGAPTETLLNEFEKEFESHHEMPLKIYKETLNEKAIVIKGRAKFIAAEDTVILAYINKPKSIKYGCPRTIKPEKSEKFFRMLSEVIQKPIVSEIENPEEIFPPYIFFGYPESEADIKKILKNVAKQLNVKITEEIREIEFLTVRK